MQGFLTLLAQADGGAKGGGAGGFDPTLLFLMMIPFLLFIILPMRREKKQRQEMLSSVEKGCRVVVNGAILGTVIQVDAGDEKDPEEKLVIKIDENSNLKMRVLRSSITRVYKKDPKEGA
jgi:preprotein translocase subunit YajC